MKVTDVDHGIPLRRSKFTAVVGKEPYKDDFGVVKYVYFAMVLEWHLCASGETLEKCRKNLEHVLITQNAIFVEYPDTQEPSPAHEDYQRVKTSGTHIVHSDVKFYRYFGYDRIEIVDRWEIDLEKLEWKVVMK
jgi:hypothetical protein